MEPNMRLDGSGYQSEGKGHKECLDSSSLLFFSLHQLPEAQEKAGTFSIIRLHRIRFFSIH